MAGITTGTGSPGALFQGSSSSLAFYGMVPKLRMIRCDTVVLHFWKTTRSSRYPKSESSCTCLPEWDQNNHRFFYLVIHPKKQQYSLNHERGLQDTVGRGIYFIVAGFQFTMPLHCVKPVSLATKVFPHTQ